MPPKRPRRPEDPELVARRQKRLDVERIALEAAQAARGALRSLIESQPKYPGTQMKIPVSEINLSMVSMAQIAATFERRLLAAKSSVHALQQRLCRWAKSGIRDIVVERGRPPTKTLTPVKKKAVSRLIDRHHCGHLSAAQVNAVASDLVGSNLHSADTTKRQENKQRQSLRAAGIIRAVSTPTTPSLLHASNSSGLRFKLHKDLTDCYKACPLFKSEPIRIVNFDEGNDPDRAGRNGQKAHGFTTVAKLKKEGRKQVRTVSMNDGAGTGSSCPWYAANGECIAKTPIVQAPPGWDFGPEFRAPPSFTEPARHSGIPFLPGMSLDYFTAGNTRVFCTESGVNNMECLTRMFIDFVYPLWRAKVHDGPLLLIYDSCHCHNWTRELSKFFADKDVHVLKLYHNTTTSTQACDCGINLEVRKRTAKLQDRLMAAFSFENAYLGTDLEVQFRDCKRVRFE
jgi:hypothetical protein